MSDPSVTILNPNGITPNNDILMLGDYIEINTSQKINLKKNDTVDMYLVYTESNQVIQRVKLQSGE